MSGSRRLAASLALALAVVAAGAAAAPAAAPVRVEEYRLSPETLDTLRAEWIDQLLERNEPGTWAEMKFDLNDRHLSLMGLPPAEVLRSRSYPRPTMVSKDGATEEVALPTVATFAGAGYFGIRPGAFLLLIDAEGIGWCSMAHVYGAPGSYDISTAGHCGKTGTTATVIAGFGNRDGVLNPILLDFGTFSTSRDGGLGNDYALIDIEPQFQNLVTPTMPVWGGPRGVFTKSGSVASVAFSGNTLTPSVTVNPDPFLAQSIVHYGHGTGIGTGGTPRAGTAVSWGASHYMFFGAISPGDSGSGANTVGGDTVGANMEAAGIMTHLYVDPLMRKGLGIMGGTRSTALRGAPASGQLVSYPVPAPLLP